MIHYEVVYVSDADLPPTQPWVIVRTGSEAFLFIKESAVGEDLLSQVWRSWQHIDGSRDARRSLVAALSSGG